MQVASLVVVSGDPFSGKSRLALDLCKALEGYEVFSAVSVPALAPEARGEAVVEARAEAMRQQFRQTMRALRTAAQGRCVIVDGMLAETLALVELDRRDGRITASQHSKLVEFGSELRRRSEAPHVLIYLEASAAACAARGSAHSAPQHEALAAVLRAGLPSRGRLSASAYAVCRRGWEEFGPIAPIRDTVLCADPPIGWSASLAPPSLESVESLLADAWAEASTEGARGLPSEVAALSVVAPAPSPSLSPAEAAAMAPPMRLDGGCHSPASVLHAGLEEPPAPMAKLGEGAVTPTASREVSA